MPDTKIEIAAIPTFYEGVRFRSRLEARWAAYADLSGWSWKYEPIDLKGWTPDFLMRLPCHHSECCTVEYTQCPYCRAPITEVRIEPVVFQDPWGDPNVPDVTRLVPFGARCHGCGREHELCYRDENFCHELYVEVKPYRTLEEFDGHKVCEYFDNWVEPVGAKFGIDPSVSAFQIAHGAGGGIYGVLDWGPCTMKDWHKAGNIVQWKARES